MEAERATFCFLSSIVSPLLRGAYQRHVPVGIVTNLFCGTRRLRGQRDGRNGKRRFAGRRVYLADVYDAAIGHGSFPTGCVFICLSRNSSNPIVESGQQQQNKKCIEKTTWATLKTRKMRDKFCLVDSSALPQSLLAEQEGSSSNPAPDKICNRIPNIWALTSALFSGYPSAYTRYLNWPTFREINNERHRE